MHHNLKRFSLLPLIVVLLASVVVAAAGGNDRWISVRSHNFFLVSNAKEKEVRASAEKLEQFRQAFKTLFPNARFDQSIPTNVIVFKNDDSYRPFKPKRDDGKADDWLAGYFQSGEDANYITFSTEGPDSQTFGTIFHEYVHFIVDSTYGEAAIPPWFNEGLAEYYQTIEIDGKKVNLGKPQVGHLRLLQRSKLIPLKEFFAIDGRSLHQNGGSIRNVFYAQAWALVHYLIESGQGDKMSNFLQLVMNGTDQETAFRRAFGIEYADLEKTLKKYAGRRSYKYRTVTFKNELNFDAQMKVSPISEYEADAYLGDLLYHIHEYGDAEIYLQKALRGDPENVLANTSYGMVQMRRRNFEKAKTYLEKAVTANRRNYIAQYSYAYVLSREAMDEFGFVSGIPEDTADKMRSALNAAIGAEPKYAPSYQLMAFVDLVSGENLDRALLYLSKGLRLKPGDPQMELLQAKIYLRQEKYDPAEKIAKRIAENSGSQEYRVDARRILTSIASIRKSLDQVAKNAARQTGSRGVPILLKRSQVTPEEIAQLNQENRINRMNLELPAVRPGEKLVVGRLRSINCAGGKPRYVVRTRNGDLNLVSDDFAGLQLLTLDEKKLAVEVSCTADLSSIKTVFTYRTGGRTGDGTLLSMTFVPDFFRIKTREEIANTRPVVIVEDEGSVGSIDSENIRQVSMMEALRRSLRKPEPGEVRVLGRLKKINCGRQYTTYEFEASGRQLFLRNDPKVSIHIITYTPDAEGIQFRCGFGPLNALALITYRPAKSKKLDGNVIAIEFVPASFTLE